jgi:2-oxoisovalerate dehydrogenase E1 component
MIALGLIDENRVASVRRQAQDAMTAAGGRAGRGRPDKAGKRRIRPQLWPDPGFVDVGVRGDASDESLAGARTDGAPGALALQEIVRRWPP